jgi:hypothetical protein
VDVKCKVFVPIACRESLVVRSSRLPPVETKWAVVLRHVALEEMLVTRAA